MMWMCQHSKCSIQEPTVEGGGFVVTATPTVDLTIGDNELVATFRRGFPIPSMVSAFAARCRRDSRGRDMLVVRGALWVQRAPRSQWWPRLRIQLRRGQKVDGGGIDVYTYFAGDGLPSAVSCRADTDATLPHRALRQVRRGLHGLVGVAGGRSHRAGVAAGDSLWPIVCIPTQRSTLCRAARLHRPRVARPRRPCWYRNPSIIYAAIAHVATNEHSEPKTDIDHLWCDGAVMEFLASLALQQQHRRGTTFVLEAPGTTPPTPTWLTPEPKRLGQRPFGQMFVPHLSWSECAVSIGTCVVSVTDAKSVHGGFF